ncbi:hypothetical protein CAI21_05620 [Alkalilimnicola ehrlichii]|uniref:Lipoprotein n=1 Tax=Alkalilimnicola ehrlichii TaxID=351052 RepID=A0A3E0X104_9GAMM|nr:hypothetical protein [Alkalilimnicola ehrlichii]RFA30525.1 hypothetical protein CAI21_05620 [Alkalilimnicola ehrlichii]RFA38073.1 hypothetical protein CAL65_06990 [Alkalilimnicola ehrlichii]
MKIWVMGAVLVAAAVLLVGCSNDLPPEKMEYVGLWRNHDTSILITEGGRLEYESKRGSVQRSLSAPIKTFTETSIEAGFLFFGSEFAIDRGPQENDGVWTIVIDGNELYKADPLGRLPQRP